MPLTWEDQKRIDGPHNHPASPKSERGPTMMKEEPERSLVHPASTVPVERGPTMTEKEQEFGRIHPASTLNVERGPTMTGAAERQQGT